MKADEAKYVESFQRQKEELKAKKLADQQKELLREMNQKDVDAMLSKHKRELEQMDDALNTEQMRQLQLMRNRMKGRNAQLSQDKIVRQIKLAELQKVKQQELSKAQEYQQQLSEQKGSFISNEKLNQMVSKAGLMQKLRMKQAYSRPIFNKRYQDKEQRLYAFLGQGVTADWASSQGADDISHMSELSIATKAIEKDFKFGQAITYQMLLEHIQSAESNYDAIKNPRVAGQVASRLQLSNRR